MMRLVARGRSAVLAAGLAALLAGCGGGSSPPATGTPAAAPAPTGGAAEASAAAAAPAATAAAARAETEQTATATATPSATSPAPSGAARSFADQVLESINAARAVARKCGATDHPAAAPLKWQTQVEQAALAQAQYLQQNNLFTHTGANGSSVGDRVTATGYVWQTVGENIAAGYPDLTSVVQGWIDSPGHCVNVMNPNFTDLGVVVLQGTSSNTYRNYWAMVLARPR
jgi:uncharacterized protein YkwD